MSVPRSTRTVASGGGYIAAGYASAHPGDIAGLVFIDTARPYGDAATS